MAQAGRPTKYDQAYDDKAYKLCLLGATDKELASFFEVNEDSIHEWKKVHPSFSESLKKGKDEADATVAQKLYHRATGYSHEAVKIVADAKSGAEHIVPFTEHYPPDTTAAIFWLKNRQRDKWRDRTEHDLTTKDEKLPAPIADNTLVDAFINRLKNDTDNQAKPD